MLNKLPKYRNTDLHKTYKKSTRSNLPEHVNPYTYLSLFCEWAPTTSFENPLIFIFLLEVHRHLDLHIIDST